MMHVTLLAKSFQNDIVMSYISRDEIFDIEGILMTDNTENVASPSFFYLSEFKDAISFIEKNRDVHLNLFVSSSVWDDSYPLPQHCNVVVINLPLSIIYNKLFRVFNRWNSFSDALAKIPQDPKYTQQLLDTARTKMEFEGYFYVLSPSFQVLHSSSDTDAISDAPLDRLNEGDYLSDLQINACLESLNSPVRDDKTIQHNRIAYRIYPIKGTGLLGYLLIFGVPADSDYKDMLSVLINTLSEYLAPINEDELKDYQLLSKIMEDVFISYNMDIDDLQKRLSKTPDPVDTYICNVVIDFDKEKISLKKYFAELKELFKTKNIAFYDGKIIVWLSGSTQMFKPNFDEKAFDVLLKKNHSYAIISNPGRFLRGIRTLYIQCKEMLPIISSFDFVLKGRSWAYYDELNIFHIIQLCSKSLNKVYGHGKLVYLSGPELMEVIRYDQIHNSNLLEFLYSFLHCGMNIGKTAELLHMHRNTVVYKIKKLESLLRIDSINDTNLTDLEISVHIMMYAKYVAKEEYRIAQDKAELKTT